METYGKYLQKQQLSINLHGFQKIPGLSLIFHFGLLDCPLGFCCFNTVFFTMHHRNRSRKNTTAVIAAVTAQSFPFHTYLLAWKGYNPPHGLYPSKPSPFIYAPGNVSWYGFLCRSKLLPLLYGMRPSHKEFRKLSPLPRSRT